MSPKRQFLRPEGLYQQESEEESAYHLNIDTNWQGWDKKDRPCVPNCEKRLSILCPDARKVNQCVPDGRRLTIRKKTDML